MSDYTPSLDEARDRYSMPWHEPADYDWAKERAEFDRMIEAVRAEEREKAAQIAEREIPEMGSHILETDYRRGKAVAASDIAARIRNQEAGE